MSCMRIKNQNLINYSIILFGLYPIMPNSFKGVLMIFLFLSSSFYFLKSKNRKFNLKPFLINSSLFFLFLISMFFTEDLYYGFKKLGPGISILLFPLVFYILLGNYELKRETIQKTLNFFSLSTFLFSIIFIIHFKFNVLPLFPEISFFDINYIRSYLRVLPWLGQHPIYVGLFFGISIINLSNQSCKFYKKEVKYSILSISLLIFLTISLFIISNKGTVLSLLLIGLFIYLFKSKNKIKSLTISLFSIIVLFISILFTPHINSRFKELIKSKTYSIQNLDKNNSSQIRIAIWKTSIDNIKKAPMFGYGIGDVQSVLNNSYRDNFPYLLKEQHNSHNQFLGIWLSTGIIGLIIFLYFLFFNFNIAFRNEDFIFLAILLFFCLNFLTENIIERQTGATLFFFFINLFGYYNYSINTGNIKE